jgi:hypothetical protein
MSNLTQDGQRIVADVAQRHGVSQDAVIALLNALVAGGGTMAQFNHYDLGGMGQWAQGGMIMVGDMFNQGLKYRVDNLCNELAGILRMNTVFAPQPQYQGVSLYAQGGSGNWWPAELGYPSSSGSQNNMSYACFPNMRRLAILNNGQVTVYDTGDHNIGGFSQQQGGDQSLTFSSQWGTVRVNDLPVVIGNPPMASAPPPVYAAPVYAPPPVQAAPIGNNDDIFRSIEQLASLHQKGVLTDAEFASKKAELLSRL